MAANAARFSLAAAATPASAQSGQANDVSVTKGGSRVLGATCAQLAAQGVRKGVRIVWVQCRRWWVESGAAQT